MNSILIQQVMDWKLLAYVLIFVAMIIEGDIFLFIAGFLARRGALDIGDTIIVVLAGVLIGDILWYKAGFHLRGSLKLFKKLTKHIPALIDSHLLKRTSYSIFVSKFIYGLHHIVLMRVGMLRVSIKRCIQYDLIAIVIWVFVVGGLGYVSGAAFILAKHYIHVVELWLLAILSFFLITEFFVYKIFKKRL